MADLKPVAETAVGTWMKAVELLICQCGMLILWIDSIQGYLSKYMIQQVCRHWRIREAK